MDSLEDPGDEARLEITTDDLDGDDEEGITHDEEDIIHHDSIHGILFHGQSENGSNETDETATLAESVQGVESVTDESDPQMTLVGFNGDSQDSSTMQADPSALGSDLKDDGEHSHEVSIGDGTITHTEGLQTITLSDGTTALVQPHGMKEGQTIQLEDGTTAILQSINKDGLGPKLIEGQTIQLEDGTTAFVQAGSAMTDGLQAVQLEDGSTAFIAPGLFGEANELTSLSLEQITGQAQLLPETKPPVELTNVASSVAASDNHPQLINITPTTDAAGVTGDSQDATSTKTQVHMSSERALALGDKAFRCNFDGCGRLYTTQHHLKVHERSHTGDKPFHCDFPSCGKSFATGYGLKSHTRVHTGEKPYHCPEESCTKSFKTSGDLQKHVRTHTGERPFKCPFEGCNRSFTTSNIRKVHIRTHTGERPYVCSEEGCGKAFASATNYKNHIRIHSGEKPYVCTVQGCGKRFTEYSSLYKHHVVHTHSKPYVCNHCGKNYRQTSTLAMHKRTAHGEDTTAENEAQLAGAPQLLPFTGGDGAKTQLQFHLTEAPKQSDGENTLVINTTDASQVTMVTSEGLATMGDGTGIASAPASVLQQLTGGITLSAGDLSNLGSPQIYVVTDPSQLEALTAIAQQQLQAQQPQVQTKQEEVDPGAGVILAIDQSDAANASEAMDTE